MQFMEEIDLNNINDYGKQHYLNKTQQTIQDDKIIARITLQQSKLYTIVVEGNLIRAQTSGKFNHQVTSHEQYPVVGDFVEVAIADINSIAIINKVLPRFSAFYRKLNSASGAKCVDGILESGTTEAQVLASNIDTVMILCGLDGDFNMSRIERYLLTLSGMNVNIVIILNKVDLCDNPQMYINQIYTRFPYCDVVAISAQNETGLDMLASYLQEAHTLLFVGSSGVGKSTLVNAIFKDNMQATMEINTKTSRGKHTTTARHLFLHDDGYMLVDVPGIRGLQIWTDEAHVNEMFDDILALFGECRFNNCTHNNEPGCAVIEAFECGELTEERYTSYHKYLKEVKRLEQKKKARDKIVKNKYQRKKFKYSGE
ncbi:MAG: ribosome small subunit-dependent GTPase A [Clostridiales bacterium]|nr:ribosome small subunit-dependent GTPase A [Clostridiales bacterium]